MAARILIAVSTPAARLCAEEGLLRDGHHVVAVADDGAVWDALVAQRFDLVIAELPAPALTLVGFLRRIEQVGHEAELIVVVPAGRRDLGWLAMNEGAHGYLEQPLSPEPLRLLALRSLEQVRLRRECVELRALLRSRHAPARWLDLPSIARLRSLIESRLTDSLPILFQGERGTEAPDLARLVHYWGRHSVGPFLSLPAGLQNRASLEAALFGAPRGPSPRRPGWVEQAHGGSLLIEDVTQIPIEIQARLARFLESGQILPSGAETAIHAGVRLFFSTHQDPDVSAHNGTLDPSLLVHLRNQIVRIPPLRERSEDVPDLARALLDAWGSASIEITGDAKDWLQASPWPGNRIQLEATVLRALLSREEETALSARDLQRGSAAFRPAVASYPPAPQRTGTSRTTSPIEAIHSVAGTPQIEPSRPNVATHSIDTSHPNVATHPIDTSHPDVATHPIDTSQPDGATHPIDTSQPDVATHPIDTSQPGVATPPIETSPFDDATHPVETTHPDMIDAPDVETDSPMHAAEEYRSPNPLETRASSNGTNGHPAVSPQQDSIEPEDLETADVAGSRRADDLHLPVRGVDLVRLERRLIEEALDRTQGNQTHAARLLGLTRQTLIYRMQKHGIR